MPVTPRFVVQCGLMLLSVAVGIASPRQAAAQDTSLRATVVVSGLTAPVAFVQDPTQPGVQFVVEQGGRIRVVRDGALLPGDFLNLAAAISSGGEQGLLGLAFTPDYATSRRFFVNFTNTSGHTVIARFLRSAADPLRADPSTQFDLRWPDGNRFITQPFANHNGGDVHFGSDGYLYIGMGDGGSGNDPNHFAQNPMSLLGKMLRIDVAVPDSDPEGYNVPFDNPFVGDGRFLAEIWALGLRNPFRFTVDTVAHGGSGALLIGDVGQNAWEEVDFDPSGRGGRNYGWRNREGAHDNVTTRPPATLPLIDPIVEYSHAEGNVITGGVVYRGSGLGLAFFGRYFYADFGASRVWSARLVLNPATGEAAGSGVTEHTFGIPVGNISAFGVDASCEVYMVDYGGGRLLRIDPIAGSAGTGCATPDPFLSSGGGAWLNGGWLPPDHPLAAGLGVIAASSGSGGTTGSAACTTPLPASNWVCINGGWVPPDHPLALAASATPAGGGGTGTTGTTGTAACTTVMPASTWVCVNGGWVPPDHPLALAPRATPAGTGGTGTTGPTGTVACSTVKPASNWVCVNGGWVPPDHPLALGVAKPPAGGPTTCTIPDPFVGIPGLVGVCVNGDWIPRIIGG